MKGTPVDWALWAGSIVVGLLALLLLAWALFSDRSRGRKRCPRCWYSMDGVTPPPGGAGDDGLRCPECGRAIADERQLRRTRRKWRWVPAAALLGLVAYALGVTPRVIEKGWTSAIPTTALVTIWPVPVKDWVAKHLDDQVVTNPVIDELDARLKNNELAGWQCSLWQGRVESCLRKEGRFGVAREAELLDKLTAMRITRDIVTERLEDALKIYQTELGIPIDADWKALEVEQIKTDTLVSVHLFSSNGVDALIKLLAAANVDVGSPVEWRVQGDKIVVGVWDPNTVVLPVCTHELNRLVIKNDAVWTDDDERWMIVLDERLAHMRQILTSNIDPEGWMENGGDRNSISIVGTSAFVRAPALVQVQIGSLLDSMDRAWNAQAAATSENEWRQVADLDSRLQRTAMRLPAGSMSVEALIDALRVMTGAPIDVDWQGLATVNVLAALQVEVGAEEATAQSVLDTYIAHLVIDSLDGVDWTIHSGAVRIGPSPRISVLRITRVYNVADLVASPARPAKAVQDRSDALVRQITQSIDPDGWVDAGGDRSWIKRLGPLAIITTTARRHLEIDDLLAKLRSAKNPPAASSDHP